MVLLRRKKVLAAKQETTAGTAVSLAGTDGAFNCYDVEIQPTIEMEEREGQGAFNYLTSLPGAQMGVVTFKIDLSFDGLAVPTWASTFLPCCGFPAISTGKYEPVSAGPATNQTLTIGVYEDGKLKQIAGAMGNCVLNFPAGKTAFAEFTFTGKWLGETAEALITPTYPTVKGLRYATATTTFASFALNVSEIAVDFGNSVIMRESGSHASGYLSALVSNRKPQITADPESVSVSDQNRYSNWLTQTTGALVIDIPGPEAGSKLKVTAPAAQIDNIQGGDRNDMFVDQITWTATKKGALSTDNNQELSIEFEI